MLQLCITVLALECAHVRAEQVLAILCCSLVSMQFLAYMSDPGLQHLIMSWGAGTLPSVWGQDGTAMQKMLIFGAYVCNMSGERSCCGHATIAPATNACTCHAAPTFSPSCSCPWSQHSSALAQGPVPSAVAPRFSVQPPQQSLSRCVWGLRRARGAGTVPVAWGTQLPALQYLYLYQGGYTGADASCPLRYSLDCLHRRLVQPLSQPAQPPSAHQWSHSGLPQASPVALTA